ncbi:UNVERIFIED_CONTAM: hypothetical protein K2H54_057597 [Gekko kuhli]
MAAATAASQRDPVGDWQDFSGFQPPATEVERPKPSATPAGEEGPWDDGDGGDLGSRLPLCFQPPPRLPRNCEGGGEAYLLPRPLGEQSALQEDEIWNALTDNYGNVMPVDWKSSHARSLHLPTLNLSEKGYNDQTLPEFLAVAYSWMNFIHCNLSTWNGLPYHVSITIQPSPFIGNFIQLEGNDVLGPVGYKGLFERWSHCSCLRQSLDTGSYSVEYLMLFSIFMQTAEVVKEFGMRKEEVVEEELALILYITVNDNLNLDLSDDEELREQLDMHSIIVSCINEEPIFTAEQVIEEIEEMMQESPDPDDDKTPTQSDRLSLLSQEIQTLKRSNTNHNYKEGVKKLSVTELNDLLEETETAIKDYSEELVQQLALRDELEFEKEVKNSFISVLIEVQNKQREQKEMAKKKKKLKNGSPQNGKQERGHMPGTVRILCL